LVAGLVALAFGAFSAWVARQWPPSWIPAALFLVSASLLFVLAFWAPIRISGHSLLLGAEEVPWDSIIGIDHTHWAAPLVVKLTLANGGRRWLVYPGDPEPAQLLIECLYRFAENARIDGAPRASAALPPAGTAAPHAPRTPLLRPEDEAEVEQLYQRLRAVGHLDSKDEIESQPPGEDS
jgi:hypothetical protein